MDKNLKKILIYLALLLTTFLGSVLVLDKINQSVDEDLSKYKETYRQTESNNKVNQ